MCPPVTSCVQINVQRQTSSAVCAVQDGYMKPECCWGSCRTISWLRPGTANSLQPPPSVYSLRSASYYQEGAILLPSSTAELSQFPSSEAGRRPPHREQPWHAITHLTSVGATQHFEEGGGGSSFIKPDSLCGAVVQHRWRVDRCHPKWREALLMWGQNTVRLMHFSVPLAWFWDLSIEFVHSGLLLIHVLTLSCQTNPDIHCSQSWLISPAHPHHSPVRYFPN